MADESFKLCAIALNSWNRFELPRVSNSAKHCSRNVFKSWSLYCELILIPSRDYLRLPCLSSSNLNLVANVANKLMPFNLVPEKGREWWLNQFKLLLTVSIMTQERDRSIGTLWTSFWANSPRSLQLPSPSHKWDFTDGRIGRYSRRKLHRWVWYFPPELCTTCLIAWIFKGTARTSCF